MEAHDLFGPVISKYTRADAINDGLLVEIRADGWELPTAIESSVSTLVDSVGQKAIIDALVFAYIGGKVVEFNIEGTGLRATLHTDADGSDCCTIEEIFDFDY